MMFSYYLTTTLTTSDALTLVASVFTGEACIADFVSGVG
jgi:hypothetical protein